ncbi:MAG: helix-turn-helix domain-containing protein [Acidobacteriaceae bacterium]|nr:helix-turn-helix domain-containing protein [Acidobacteriaceae bacterium]
MLDAESCWESVKDRDKTQDGRFYFGVMTTGVFCRPSCACRLPLRKNVRFYESSTEAQRDGLRPRLRCRPLEKVDRDLVRIRELVKYIQDHDDMNFRLADLSKRAGLSLFHLQRKFRAVVGVSPRQYVEALRLKKLKGGLRAQFGVANAIYEAGFSSSSRVYERANTRLGMTPNQYRQGGCDVTITYVTVDSPFGLLMIGATDRGLASVQFGKSEQELAESLSAEYPRAKLEPMHKPYPSQFEEWITALNRHLMGRQAHVDLPLDVRATAFQMRVWNYLQSSLTAKCNPMARSHGVLANPLPLEQLRVRARQITLRSSSRATASFAGLAISAGTVGASPGNAR